MRECSVVDCDRVEQTRRGFCRPHYRRFMATGDPLKIRAYPASYPVEAKLREVGWTEVSRGMDTPCWEWNGNCTRLRGYGSFHLNGRGVAVSRVSYEVFVGEIPPGLLVRHKCDNPPCMNPEHLETGTTKQNVQDMLDRGRHNPPVGSRNGRSILDEGKVADIFALRDSGKHWAEVGPMFGVSGSTVYSIWKGHRWRHVTEGVANE